MTTQFDRGTRMSTLEITDDTAAAMSALVKRPKSDMARTIQRMVGSCAARYYMALDESIVVRRITPSEFARRRHRGYAGQAKLLLAILIQTLGRKAWPAIRRALRAEMRSLRIQHPNGMIAQRYPHAAVPFI